MLTARDTLDDKLAGFEAGADDYLVKPFALQELAARLDAIVRRGSARRPAQRPLPSMMTATCSGTAELIDTSGLVALMLDPDRSGGGRDALGLRFP